MNKLALKEKIIAVADERMNNATVRKLWHSFSFTMSEIDFEKGDEFTFRVGDTALPTLDRGKEYALCVDEKGIAVKGRDFGGLMRGVMSLLMKIEYGEDAPIIKYTAEQSEYRIKNRMIHICVFPENDIYFIKKLIRLCALCQYTHIVIEFWGMLRYDCLKELSWPNAFTKDQARELITECRELGIEPIPMFNQLGHATACRLIYGKHVVLDQNPRLQYLFTPDGWAWDIHSEKVRALLKTIRKELYELFGDGEYIHVGCDEAYYYTRSAEDRKKMPAFLKELTDEVVSEGRRPMIWMDMLLERDKYNDKYRAYATCEPDEVEIMQESLNPKTVMVDWQYNMPEAPIETTVSLKDNIRDTLGAPWFKKENYCAFVDTVAQLEMHGIMMTTWHTLKDHMESVLGCAKKCGAKSFVWSDCSGLREETATMLRRVSFEGNEYTDCGWSKYQIEI
ncbi:MAG: family 20 glycosylhydrolase [Clostridia bacterium]|nr:family 20 glycosylhydrolase [Clostridia bacterium]